MRTGRHDVTEYDWLHYLDFLDKVLRWKDCPSLDIEFRDL